MLEAKNSSKHLLDGDSLLHSNVSLRDEANSLGGERQGELDGVNGINRDSDGV